MKRKFVKLSILMVSITALLSVGASIFYYCADTYSDQGSVLPLIAQYVKMLFDVIAVFTGYGVVIYAFSRYQANKAIYSIAIFGISVLISHIYSVVATSITTWEDIVNAVDTNGDTIPVVRSIVTLIYTSLGNCVVSQLLPCVLVAFLTFMLTKDGARRLNSFISWKNPIHRSMIITTLVIFGINILSLVCIDIIPFAYERDFLLYEYEIWERVVIPIVSYVVLYLLVQYSMYVLTYKICYKHGED